jgi:hypothetical protein
VSSEVNGHFRRCENAALAGEDTRAIHFSLGAEKPCLSSGLLNCGVISELKMHLLSD